MVEITEEDAKLRISKAISRHVLQRVPEPCFCNKWDWGIDYDSDLQQVVWIRIGADYWVVDETGVCHSAHLEPATMN